MIGQLFRRRPPAPAIRRAAAPAGAVVWAVGDVHGRLDLLEPLVAAIEADLAASSAARKLVVFLGDYIDRGPDSRGVVDRLIRLKAQAGIEARFLRGNHEDRMEAFLTQPDLGPGWCDYGGREALMSWGVTPPMLKTDADGWARACEQLNAAVTDEQRAFLRDQEAGLVLGDYFFAHAGARPGVPLARQDPQDLMWLRGAFLDHPAPFEQVVVHGHTPCEIVHADHRRIGIDTGGYATGVLTGLRLEGEAREVLQTSGGGARVVLSRRLL